ncbi:MAG: lipoate--protein ligase family protein [Phycisphaerae bacterium]
MSHTLRVLQDPPLDGPTNMARDEALMTCVGRGESPPTLRLYQWDPPTISLGYFQRYADYESLPPPAGTLAVVRRLTGGGAILHDLELTYSLALPISHSLVSKGPNRLYETAHDAVIACLGSLGVSAVRCGRTDHSNPTRGPFFCFERRHDYDILIGHDKIAGSAQRRTRKAILQHGSIVLGNRYTQQTTAALPLPFDEGIRRVRPAFVEQLADVTDETFEPGDWSAAELTTADALVVKYATSEWTKRT